MHKDKFLSSPDDYRYWSRVLDREWNQGLTPGEFSVVRFTFDRTIGWSKEWEVIPVRHFTEGVIAKGGECFGAIGLTNRPTVRKLISKLVDRGAIRREPTSGRSFRYALNLNWEPDMKTPKSQKAIERAEKRRQGVANRPMEGVANRPLEGSQTDPKEDKKEREAKASKGTGGNPPSFPSRKEELLESIQKVRDRSAALRDMQKREGYFLREDKTGFVPHLRALRKTWEDLHAEHFKGRPCAPLTQRGLSMVRAYCREWGQRNKESEFTEDYLPWLFRNWSIMRKTQLSWMNNCPEQPDPMFVASAKMRVHFEEGWSRKAQIEHLATLSPRDREVEWLKSKGVDGEVAEQMATEKKDAKLEVKRLQEERAKLEVAEQTARMKRRPAKKSARAVRATDESESSGLPQDLPQWED